MPENAPLPELPTPGEKLSAWLGFKVPTIALPQTAKNLDKAVGRLISAGAENLCSRIERGTLLREARAKSEASVIEAAGAHFVEEIKEHSSMAERALEFSFSESILKQSNRESIAKLAVDDLSLNTEKHDRDADAEIDDDWLNLFSEFASYKSNADIQILWSKILSGKIRNPSSFSLRSLQLLSAIDTNDANIVHRILGYAINQKFILKSPFESSLSDILLCEDIGVLTGGSGLLSQSYKLTASSGGVHNLLPKFVFFEMPGALLLARFNEKKELKIPCFSLTRFGVELCRLSGSFERNEQYEQQFIDFLKANGATVQRSIRNKGNKTPLYDV
jgi:hypothetical protein